MENGNTFSPLFINNYGISPDFEPLFAAHLQNSASDLNKNKENNFLSVSTLEMTA